MIFAAATLVLVATAGGGDRLVSEDEHDLEAALARPQVQAVSFPLLAAQRPAVFDAVRLPLGGRQGQIGRRGFDDPVPEGPGGTEHGRQVDIRRFGSLPDEGIRRHDATCEKWACTISQPVSPFW
jgi:hypothetical protein